MGEARPQRACERGHSDLTGEDRSSTVTIVTKTTDRLVHRRRRDPDPGARAGHGPPRRHDRGRRALPGRRGVRADRRPGAVVPAPARDRRASSTATAKGARPSTGRPASGMRALGATLERTRLAYAQDAAGKGWDRALAPRRLRHPREPSGPPVTRSATTCSTSAAPPSRTALYVSPHRWEEDVVGRGRAPRRRRARHRRHHRRPRDRRRARPPRASPPACGRIDDAGRAVPGVHRHLRGRPRVARADATQASGA